jgi:peptidyl-dipeptidase Dcp
LPPFALIKPFHYKPAILDHAFPLHLQELQQIVDSIDSPTFENTIAAYDRAGSLTKKLISLFMNQCSSECPPDLQAIQLELSPLIAQHENTVATFPGLFPKISLIYQNYVQQNQEKSQILNSEQIRLIERIYLNFLRAGAQFDSNSQLKYKEIIMELATLQTQFAQNVLADESSFFLELSSSCGELDGLPDDLIASAQQAAIERNLPDGSYGITLSRSLVEPFLTYSTIREKREIAWKAWINRYRFLFPPPLSSPLLPVLLSDFSLCCRGQLDPSRDNASIIQRILILRNQQAIMHGYRNFAEYSTADTMAKTSDAVMELLLRVWEPAKVACNREREMLEDYIRSLPDGHRDKIPTGSAVEGWDWRYYSEKIRQVKYSFDASQLKPYFSLPQMCEALFDCAKQLFGLEFQLMENLEEDESSNGGSSSSRSFSSYHRDVKTYEVYEMNPLTNQKEVRAIFIHDNYSRPNKQSGAWMSEYRVQTKNYLPCPTPAPSRSMIRSSDGSIIPIIVNNNNFSKAPEGSVTLLSYDDARTLFHEFGHGLHGILSNVTYTTLASTSVLKDFVELPSQLFEHWIAHPEVLKKYAKHYLTKENLPLELIQKVEQVQNYNNGFQTIEYLSCALFDQYLHQLVVLPTADDSTSTSTGGAATSAVGENFDLNEIEAKYLQSIGMPTSMVLRHRPTHFLHLFSGSDYAAGYYVYLWAEVLDADGFDAFLEVGNIFDHETAQRLRKYIYSTGNSIEPGEAYRLFRGRDPTVIPMLKKKGLLEE